jgi:hypothetical protein
MKPYESDYPNYPDIAAPLPWHGTRLSFLALFLIALFRVKTINLVELANHLHLNAIISHNNALGRLHDKKWAISINGLKNYFLNQRAIEKIVQERKDEIE